MAGSWELVAATNQVLVAILTREMVTTAFAFALRTMQIPGTVQGLAGMPYDHARNSACENLLSIGWQWLFFLDDDMIVPPDTILRLRNHNLPIVSGLYYRRNEPICPVMLRDTEKGREWIQSYKLPDLIPVDYVGSGCLLIHRSVLEKVPRPWFEWKVDRTDLAEKERMSEDFSFCAKARASGFNIYVDTSIQCIHCGLSAAKLPGELKPLVF